MWFGVDSRIGTEHTSLQSIGLCAQNMLESRLNRPHDWGDQYDHLVAMRIFTWIMKKCSYKLQKLWGKWLRIRFQTANRPTLIVCFMSEEKWVQTAKSIHLRNVHLNCFGSGYYHFVIQVIIYKSFTISCYIVSVRSFVGSRAGEKCVKKDVKRYQVCTIPPSISSPHHLANYVLPKERKQER